MPPHIMFGEVRSVPLYEYLCKPQGHRFEVRHGMNEEPVTACPVCNGEVRRVIHPVGVVFKGSGFYVTDSRKSSTAAKPASSGESKSESKPSSEPGSKSTDKSSGEPAAAS